MNGNTILIVVFIIAIAVSNIAYAFFSHRENMARLRVEELEAQVELKERKIGSVPDLDEEQ